MEYMKDMKITNSLLIALMAVAMVFVSCSKDDKDFVGSTGATFYSIVNQISDIRMSMAFIKVVEDGIRFTTTFTWKKVK